MSKSMLKNVNRRQFRNNTQRVAYRLLSANGEWISRRQLESTVGGAVTSRVRDLRKAEFGGFQVQCASATELGKRGDHRSYFYRIPPRTVRKTQVETVFSG